MNPVPASNQLPASTRPAGDPQRRLEDLAAAVRAHRESLRSSRPLGVRAQDDNLYRRLRQICGER